MKKIHLILGILLLFIFSCQKQENLANETEKATITAKGDPGICLSAEILEQEIAANPGRAKFLANLEEKTKLYENRVAAKGKKPAPGRPPGILYLPLVIHIVLTDPATIPDAQIINALQVLNKDYNKLNAELVNNPSVYLAGYSYNSVANCQIQFYVSDIVRVPTTVTEFAPGSSAMKSAATGGSDPVDPATKLNVWVCNTGNPCWSQFPGGNLLTDGIVMHYVYFGYNNTTSRIIPHETGHWLNLRHIWGDSQCGNDFVNDTPKHFGPSSGCLGVGAKSTCPGKPLIMWMNYMDYSHGACYYMFTGGQKDRMDATIINARQAYFSTTKIYPDILP